MVNRRDRPPATTSGTDASANSGSGGATGRGFTPAAAKQPAAIGGLLNLQAARDPDRPALSCEDVTLTRAELAARVNRRARALQRVGVADGDFVAIALPNGPAMLEVAFACWALGATPAPVSHRLPPLELQAILALLEPKVIVGGAAARAAGAAVVDEQSFVRPGAFVRAIAGADLETRQGDRQRWQHRPAESHRRSCNGGTRSGHDGAGHACRRHRRDPGSAVSLGTLRPRLLGALLGLPCRDHAKIRSGRHAAADRAASRQLAVPGADDDAPHLAHARGRATELRSLLTASSSATSRRPARSGSRKNGSSGSDRTRSGRCIQAPRPLPRR